MFKISKKIIVGGVVIIAVAIAVILYFVFTQGAPAKLLSVEVKNGDITEKINLIGQVKASQGVDLAFESQGKIVANYVKVGDKITKGQALLAIDDSTLQSQLRQAQAQLDVLNIDTIKNKLDSGTQTLYSGSLSGAQKSATTAKDILLIISDIQYNHFTAQNQQNITLQSVKEKAVYSLLGQHGAGLWNSQAIGQLNGGAFGLVENAVNNPTPDNIDSALSTLKLSLQDVNSLIDETPIDPALTSVERTAISLAKININTEIITTSANIQAIAGLKVNNLATIATANAQTESAKANIDVIKTQISKTVIRAPFSGQVDKDNAVVGQIVSANTPVATISNNNLEIDFYMPEIDLSGARAGSKANVTLDAFGNQVVFPATIFSVDLSPTIVGGSSVYGAKLKFDASDNRINPGMTANITISSDTHSNVLIVPRSAVVQNNNKYFVIVEKGNSQKETREVAVGLRDNKNVEITLGLKLGEKVLAY
ncbi:MAG: efflux RND transporter periplasmic adaptor subunit [Candidatus Staskawiczbacteria bacterium]|nr:efflux RND transporter periplasmic adaptor subunit [Candidatus Staskawiczbacteria bacterium]